MNNINLAEHAARRLVDRLFKANEACHGQICDWPVIGGHYVQGSDPIEDMRQTAVRALLARDWFAHNGPPDAQPLPLSCNEREGMKGLGLLNYILALYARSLEGRDYDLQEHPSFSDYASGVLWEAERVDGEIGTLPNYPDELAALKKRYPPAMLPGIGPGFYWQPPKLHAQTMASFRRSRRRAAA